MKARITSGAGNPSVNILDRFWEKVTLDGPIPEHLPELGNCWLWLNGDDGRGYGSFSITSQGKLKAHRFSYELENGPIPHKMTLDHRCLTKRCIRPSHMEVVTRGENARRAGGLEKIMQDRREGKRCHKGHLKNDFNIGVNVDNGGAYCLDCAALGRARKKKKEEEVKPTAFIFDMDGTLANVEGIRHLLKTPTGYNAFHAASIDSPPHGWVVATAHQAKADGHAILIVTARVAKWRNITASWLAVNGVPSDAMFMRGNKDMRPDYEVKKGILDKIRKTWDVVHAMDDNPSVIALWQEEGIPVTRVPGWIEL